MKCLFEQVQRVKKLSQLPGKKQDSIEAIRLSCAFKKSSKGDREGLIKILV
jgi:acyl-CoA-binding protein